MRTLAIDIETYSGTDLIKSGVYKYVEDSDFAILLLAYAYDDEPIQIVDLAQGELLPKWLVNDISNPTILKTAFNANFEITCLNAYFKKHLGKQVTAEQWECTMVKGAMMGLPFSLDQVSKVLGLEEQKMSEGRALIRYFSMPCKPTKVNGGRTRNLPTHDAVKWQTFKDYCIQDVEVERALRKKQDFFVVPKMEKDLWALDQRMISRGVLADMQFVENAIKIDDEYRAILMQDAKELTGLDNPNSLAQMKGWLSEQTGEEVTSLTKADVPTLIEGAECPDVERVLEIRQELGKTSTSKYTAFVNAVNSDNRVRGLLQYYGASRTGRWAGRLVQVQNLPQNHLPDLDLARNVVKSGDRELLELLYGNVPDTLSQLIRTSFIAPEGYRFIVSDFSAIEARVTAWLAGEQWRLDVFKSHGKIYEASASQMFNVPIESIDKGSPLRQKGKIAELALGYGGSVGALKQMGGESMGLSDEEMQDIVDSWRNANKAIVRLWGDLQDAALSVIRVKSRVEKVRGVKFHFERGLLMITLPSGRALCYAKPHLTTNRFGGESVGYWGINQTTRKWEQQETYGGKLVENVVQAIARDCLALTMLRLDGKGYKIVMHVHDEVIIEAKDGVGSLDDVNSIMAEPIDWALGLPLTADGFETNYYMKD